MANYLKKWTLVGFDEQTTLINISIKPKIEKILNIKIIIPY